MANLLIDFMNFLLSSVKLLISTIMAFLPDSPFLNINLGVFGEYIGYMNWIFPFKQAVILLTLWGSCVLIYYVYSVVLRFIKAIK